MPQLPSGQQSNYPINQGRAQATINHDLAAATCPGRTTQDIQRMRVRAAPQISLTDSKYPLCIRRGQYRALQVFGAFTTPLPLLEDDALWVGMSADFPLGASGWCYLSVVKNSVYSNKALLQLREREGEKKRNKVKNQVSFPMKETFYLSQIVRL